MLIIHRQETQVLAFGAECYAVRRIWRISPRKLGQCCQKPLKSPVANLLFPQACKDSILVTENVPGKLPAELPHSRHISVGMPVQSAATQRLSGSQQVSHLSLVEGTRRLLP